MAEAYARQFGGPQFEVVSAGIGSRPLDPGFFTLMAEMGVELGEHESKVLGPEMMAEADLMVTLCGPDVAACPVPPAGVRHLNWTIPSWQQFSSDRSTGQRALCEAIKEHVLRLLETLRQEL